MNQIIYIVIIVLLLAGLAAMCLLWRREHRLVQFLAAKEKKNQEKQGDARMNTTVQWNEEEAEQLRLIRARMELSVLQEQINPHFLYNTLDSIRSRALMDGQREIAKMTEILSRFFRYCISSSESLVRVQEELDHIRDYYYIQKYRFEDKIDMQFEVENDEILDLYMPKMTLQPLVENAMVHGLEKTLEKGTILLKLLRTDQDMLEIVVSDNGAGMSREQLIRLNERMESSTYAVGSRKGKHNGIALNNVNVRLKLTFGKSSGIHYRSLEGEGTDVIVRMPAVDIFSRVRYEEKAGELP